MFFDLKSSLNLIKIKSNFVLNLRTCLSKYGIVANMNKHKCISMFYRYIKRICITLVHICDHSF